MHFQPRNAKETLYTWVEVNLDSRNLPCESNKNYQGRSVCLFDTPHNSDKTTILKAWFKELCYVNQTTEDSALSNNLIYYVLCETKCSNNECKVQSAECRCFNNRMKYRMQTSNLGNTNYSREKTQTQICFYLVEFCHQT